MNSPLLWTVAIVGAACFFLHSIGVTAELAFALILGALHII